MRQIIFFRTFFGKIIGHMKFLSDIFLKIISDIFKKLSDIRKIIGLFPETLGDVRKLPDKIIGHLSVYSAEWAKALTTNRVLKPIEKV